MKPNGADNAHPKKCLLSNLFLLKTGNKIN